MPANSGSGFRVQGKKDAPGGGYKRNFNVNPSGTLRLSPRFKSRHSSARSARSG